MSVIDPPRRQDDDFTEFVKRNERILRGIVSCNLRDTLDDVDDALQDGLLKIWRRFESIPEDRETRARYASQIVSHASLDLTRHKWGRWGHRRTSETFVDFTKLERDENDLDQLDASERKLIHLIAVVDETLGGDDNDDGEFDRRLDALTAMMPALKPMERDVLLARHPAAGDTDLLEVSKRLKITHGQARQHYMEAMAVLRPLLSHALAPKLDREEAGRVLDYQAGVMTDKRERGRMKRHLRHCESCRALADSQRAVIATGARLVLPAPALVGLAHAPAGSTAAGVAAIAGGGTGGSGVAVAGSGVLSGFAVKLATGAAALSVAAGGITAAEHRPAHRPRRARALSAAPSVSPAPAPTQTALFVSRPAPTATAVSTQTPRVTPTPRPTQTEARDSNDQLEEIPQATATSQPIAPLDPAPPTARTSSSTQTSKSFAREFGP